MRHDKSGRLSLDIRTYAKAVKGSRRITLYIFFNDVKHSTNVSTCESCSVLFLLHTSPGLEQEQVCPLRNADGRLDSFIALVRPPHTAGSTHV